jgi:hypothetical protein
MKKQSWQRTLLENNKYGWDVWTASVPREGQEKFLTGDSSRIFSQVAVPPPLHPLLHPEMGVRVGASMLKWILLLPRLCMTQNPRNRADSPHRTSNFQLYRWSGHWVKHFFAIFGTYFLKGTVCNKSQEHRTCVENEKKSPKSTHPTV